VPASVLEHSDCARVGLRGDSAFSELVWTLVVVRVAVLHTTVDRIRYSADCRRYCSSHQGQSEYDLASTTEYTK